MMYKIHVRKQEMQKRRIELLDIATLKKIHLDTKMELEKERQERTKLYQLPYKQGILKIEA
jgi:hypothetical protein